MKTRCEEFGLPSWCTPPDEIEVRTDKTDKQLWTAAHYFFRFPGGEVIELYLDKPSEVCIGTEFESKGSRFKSGKLIHWSDVPEILRREVWKYQKVEVEGISLELEETNFVHFGDPVTIHAIQHCVRSREITLQLMFKLGYFQKVKFIRRIQRELNTLHYTDYQYVIDDKYFVTVTEKFFKGCFFTAQYRIMQYHSYMHLDEPTHGKRAANLARKTGVPWEIALLVCPYSDDECAIDLLTAIKNARGKLKINIAESKNCAPGEDIYLTDSFKDILGRSTWEKLNYLHLEHKRTMAEFQNELY